MPVFGVPLQEVLLSQLGQKGGDPHIPLVLAHCFHYFESKPSRLEDEGLFRISGANLQIQGFKDLYDKGTPPNLEKARDPHVIASLMKLYLRELPEPLCTYDLYDGFINACQKDDDKMIFEMKYLLTQLPMSNRRIIAKIVRFLGRVSTHESKNKMSMVNLATVFGPNILRPRSDSALLMMGHSPFVSKIVTTFIQRYSSLFEEEKKLGSPIQSSSNNNSGSKHHNNPLNGSRRDRPKDGSRRGGSSTRRRDKKPTDIDSPSTSASTSASTSKTEKVKKILYARAAYAFKPRNAKEIGFEKGETIIVHRVNESGWWQGQSKTGGKVGLFPGNYVVLIEDHSTSEAKSVGKALKAKANYDFQGRNEKEISFKKGDTITVVIQHSNGWHQGSNDSDPSKRMGLFPGNYVTTIDK